MASWSRFVADRPDLASVAHDLLSGFGVGLAFLATIRRDGGPRLHPISPLLYEGGIFALLIPSPKRDDLLRDPRYALHSFPRPQDDALYLTGSVARVDSPALAGGLRDWFYP